MAAALAGGEARGVGSRAGEYRVRLTRSDFEMLRIKLFTSLSPEQCLSRLSAAGDIEHSLLPSFSSAFGSKPVVGRGTVSSLRLRKRVSYANSFQTHLTVSMRGEEGGTAIEGALGMHPAVQPFNALWFGGVLLLGGTMFLVSLRSLIADGDDAMQNAWLGIVVPPLMLAFGYGLDRFGRHLARDEGRFLTEFLIRTLDARESDATGHASKTPGRARGGRGAA